MLLGKGLYRLGIGTLASGCPIMTVRQWTHALSSTAEGQEHEDSKEARRLGQLGSGSWWGRGNVLE